MARTMHKTCDGVEVRIARCARSGSEVVTPATYLSWEPCPYLIPTTLEERLAPAWHRAKFLLDPTKVEGAPARAWQWRDQVQADDRVSIKNAATDEVLFTGFVIDVDASWSGRDETVIVTAVSNAYRLARDQVVYGRWMYRKEPSKEAVFYSGLATVFNPGGVPNCHPRRRDDVAGGPADGVPVFTFDDDPMAEFWTLGGILDYLAWHHNADQPWVKNVDLKADAVGDPYSKASRLSLSVQGLSLLASMAAAADRVAWDLAEEPASAERTHILPVRRGGGRRLKVMRQPVNPDGSTPALDLDETNVFTVSVAESVAGCVTRPVIAGGRDLYEVTVPLQPAWQPDRLELAFLGPGLNVWEDVYDPDPAGQYAKRYLTSGADHADYADVGRFWDANTDGRFSTEPYGLTTPDMAALADQEAGSWPLVPMRACPMLTTVSLAVEDVETAEVSTRPPSREAVVEISFDSGESWTPVLSGVRIHPDRLAVMLTAENLGTISTGLTGADDPGDLFTALAMDLKDGTHKVQMRITCTVEAPSRVIERPDLRATAGTGFETAEFFDEGELGQRRVVAASSVFGDAEGFGDVADGLVDLQNRAVRILDASEDRSIEALLPMEWFDADARLTARVESIEGIEYDLAINRGSDKVWPRIVARTLDFANWSVALSLGSERKNGTTFQPAYRVPGPGGSEVSP